MSRYRVIEKTDQLGNKLYYPQIIWFGCWIYMYYRTIRGRRYKHSYAEKESAELIIEQDIQSQKSSQTKTTNTYEYKPTRR